MKEHPQASSPGSLDYIHKINDGFRLRLYSNVEKLVYELGESGFVDYELNALLAKPAHIDHDIRKIAEKLFGMRNKVEMRQVRFGFR